MSLIIKRFAKHFYEKYSGKSWDDASDKTKKKITDAVKVAEHKMQNDNYDNDAG